MFKLLASAAIAVLLVGAGTSSACCLKKKSHGRPQPAQYCPPPPCPGYNPAGTVVLAPRISSAPHWTGTSGHHPCGTVIIRPPAVGTPATVSPGVTVTPDGTNRATGTATSGRVTAEEQKWYDYMLENDYVDPTFAEDWKRMTSQERRAYYDEVKKIEADAANKAAKDRKE